MEMADGLHHKIQGAHPNLPHMNTLSDFYIGFDGNLYYREEPLTPIIGLTSVDHPQYLSVPVFLLDYYIYRYN
jgi:hypothetical protein